MIKEYNYKVIECGDFTEIYAYERSNVRCRKEDKSYEEQEQKQVKKNIGNIIDDLMMIEKTKNNDYQRREDNINQMKQKVKRIVYANVNQYDCTDKFLTLTFADNSKYELTRDRVVYCFNEFKRKFKKIYNDNFEYIAVIERGTKGTKRLHMHIVTFGLPYIKRKELEKIWGYGWIDVKQTRDTDGAVDYVLKYMNKTLEGNYIEKGKRFYFCSKGLKKPVVKYFNDWDMEMYRVQKDVGRLLYNVEFNSEYVGNCYYSKFKNDVPYNFKNLS